MNRSMLTKRLHSGGSALVLTVVIATLLAIVGVMFVLVSRIDKNATSSISTDKELKYAVETIIAKISRELVLDTPGVYPGHPGYEYYDYPHGEELPFVDGKLPVDLMPPNAAAILAIGDPWLASLEPKIEASDIEGQGDPVAWGQISDVTGYLRYRGIQVHDVNVDPPTGWQRIPDYPDIVIDANDELWRGDAWFTRGRAAGRWPGQWADADGDGIGDSKWIELNRVRSSKGKRFYVAIRIIDHEAMLNINTHYRCTDYRCDESKMDANYPEVIDGSSQMQINLQALTKSPFDDANEIHFTPLTNVALGRYDMNFPPPMDWFAENMIWRFDAPAESNTVPFDISDELELRSRYVIDSPASARIEALWENTVGMNALGMVGRPYEGLSDWYHRVLDPCDPNHDRRHVLTTYNLDRVINPDGGRMINVNRSPGVCGMAEDDPGTVKEIYTLLKRSVENDPGLNPDSGEWKAIRAAFAQYAANLADYADTDANVTVFAPDEPDLAKYYYGFEAQPFITAISMTVDADRLYYGVRLHNPFDMAIDVNEYELELVTYEQESFTMPLVGKIAAANYIEIVGSKNVKCGFDIANARLESHLKQDVIDEGLPPWDIVGDTVVYGYFYLRRTVATDTGTKRLYVDKQRVYSAQNETPMDEEPLCLERDLCDWHIVYQKWNNETTTDNFSLILPQPYAPNTDPNKPWQCIVPYNYARTELVTVGEISRVLTIGNSEDRDKTIGEQLGKTDPADESSVRLDFQNPYLRNLFQYVTVLDPLNYPGYGYGCEEKRVKGRININTAPWYVIAQLPWVPDELGHAIVAYRDRQSVSDPKTGLPKVDYSKGRRTAIADEIGSSLSGGAAAFREDLGFASIGELEFVVDITANDPNYSISRYVLDDYKGEDVEGFPDITIDGLGLGDGLKDDFEERDMVFSRISNLVTVRSDVFTAYILVRLGIDGPQKRVIAILDRSTVNSIDDQVRIVALHYVPDPR